MQVPVSPEINQVIETAAGISVRRGHYFVGVEHLYEALLDVSSLLPKNFMDNYSSALLTVCREIDRAGWDGAAATVQGSVFYTPRCAALIRDAARLAQRMRTGPPCAGHLLLAILADPHAFPSRLMDHLRMNRGQLIHILRNELAGHTPAHAAPAMAVANKTATATAEEPPSIAEPQPSAKPSTASGLTRDLCEAARRGALEPLVGRDKELMALLEVLVRKNKNNAILVGEAGVGKTRIVEGLAQAIVHGTTSQILSNSRILELNLSALMAGTQYRGAFEEKLLGLLDELKKSPNIILFIDEIHLIMGAGATQGDGMDLANLLKPALARGEIRCIGATTLAECRKFIEKDPALERRFQMVRVEPLTEAATYQVLLRLRPSFERHHGVHIAQRALKAAIVLTQRYIPNRYLPDKAIDAVDLACARHRLRNSAQSKPDLRTNKIVPHDICEVVSQMAAVPLEELTAHERQRLIGLDRRLRQRLIGQNEAIAQVVSAVKKSRAGLGDPNRPEAVMLFLGPTGVGKTQLAKELAEALFDAPDHLLTFDMSEYTEAHTVSRLLGAPPGYVGSEEEGRLIEAVRNEPFSILLFDEIEKAHPKIFDVFLPIFDEGRLKDSRGRIVSFRNCIIILTSNIGAQLTSESNGNGKQTELLNELRNHFRPEFINRIDDLVVFHPLLFEDIRAILAIAIEELAGRLREKGIGVHVYQWAYEYLAQQGYSSEFGARELRRTLDHLVVNPISKMLVDGEFASGDIIAVLMDDGKLVFRKEKPSTAKTATEAR